MTGKKLKELRAEIDYYADENRKLTAKNLRYAMEVDRLNKELKELKKC